jgi:hypothetical protein
MMILIPQFALADYPLTLLRSHEEAKGRRAAGWEAFCWYTREMLLAPAFSPNFDHVLN